MGDPIKSIGSCDPAQIQRQKEIEKILGMRLPDCAEISALEPEKEVGGIRAEASILHFTLIKEVDRDGKVFISRTCNEEFRDLPLLPTCLNVHRRKQSNAVDPSKVAEARALLLKEKKAETPQPETQPTVVQKNP